jgi:hypothetical protein
MEDREFLIWIYYRLKDVYNENKLLDYMHKFRAIIANYDRNKITPNDGRGKNGIKELEKFLFPEELNQ